MVISNTPTLRKHSVKIHRKQNTYFLMEETMYMAIRMKLELVQRDLKNKIQSPLNFVAVLQYSNCGAALFLFGFEKCLWRLAYWTDSMLLLFNTHVKIQQIYSFFITRSDPL